MIIGTSIAVLVTLLIPIVFAYLNNTEENKTKIFFDINLSYKFILLGIGFLIFSFLIISIADYNDLPSSINKSFVGKRIIVESIYAVLICMLFYLIIKFYLNYYSFRSLSLVAQTDYLISRIISKIKKQQKTWKNIRDFENGLSDDYVNLYHSEYYLSMPKVKNPSHIITDINYKKILNNHKMYFHLRCGFPLSVFDRVYSCESQDKVYSIQRFFNLNKYIKVEKDWRTHLLMLLEEILQNLQEAQEKKKFITTKDLHQNISVFIDKISSSDIVLDINQFIRALYEYLSHYEKLDLGEDPIYSSKVLSKQLALSSLKKGNEEMFSGLVSIFLKKDNQDIISRDVINRGAIHDIYLLFRKAVEEKIEPLYLANIMFIGIIRLKKQLEDTEIGILMKEINRKRGYWKMNVQNEIIVLGEFIVKYLGNDLYPFDTSPIKETLIKNKDYMNRMWSKEIGDYLEYLKKHGI
ncbi:MAG: hypothetical protein OCC49_19585 [Fibrobacterales bacterium]